MDMICDYMPSPKDMLHRAALNGDEVVNIPPDENGKFLAFVFKVMVDPYVGKLSFVKVLLRQAHEATRPSTTSTKRPKSASAPSASCAARDSTEGKEIILGDIVAIPKLESTIAGDTLGTKGEILKFRPIKFPKPVYSVAVFPKSRADEDKLGNAITKMLKEDRTLSYEKNPETNDAVLSGMGDMHLDIVLSKIKERYKVDLDTRTPKVPYRETIKKKGERAGQAQEAVPADAASTATSGSSSRRLRRTRASNSSTESLAARFRRTTYRRRRRDFVRAAARGYLAGYPATDFSCAIFDGSYHDVDSSGNGVQDRRFDSLQEVHGAGQPHTHGARHERRSHRPRGLPRRRNGRLQQPPRTHHGHRQRRKSSR